MSDNQTPTVLTTPKRLINAVSTPSDANGVASFTSLAFTVRGETDEIGSTFGVYSLPTAHRLAFCTAGVTGGGGIDGCVKSCYLRVKARASRIVWSVQPTLVRSALTPDDEVAPGEVIPTINMSAYPATRVNPNPEIRPTPRHW